MADVGEEAEFQFRELLLHLCHALALYVFGILLEYFNDDR